MVTAFSQKEANFSKISEHPLSVTKVLHQANISIDENGSEAAAATAVLMKPRGFLKPELPFEIRVEHPFFFVLRHNQTKEWLFVGQYVGE